MNAAKCCPILFLLLLVAGCAKKRNVSPATGNNSIAQPTITATITPVTSPSIIPHDDSFYGAILENDITLPVNLEANNGTYSRGNFIVYATYYANGVIQFTSAFNDSFISIPCYNKRITYSFMLDTYGQYPGFLLKKDSLFFQSSESAATCGDYYYISFSGKKM